MTKPTDAGDRQEEEPFQVTTIRLPESWHEALRERAFRERRPMSELIRDALREKYGLECVTA